MVMLENPRTGDRKAVKVGWSWNFFLFSGLLGLPLFTSGLTHWGALIVVLWSLDLGLPFILPATAEPGPLVLAPAIAVGLLALYLGFKGNGMVANRHLQRGYDFAQPESVEARHARQHWGAPG